MREKIWLLRWVFDPVHEGHHSNMVDSFSTMQLNNLKIIAKFLWEKDPIASLRQRKDMINLQLWNNEKIEVITQNIRWHVAHLLEFWEKSNDVLIQIWWSDKINREMEVYWKRWNTFWVVKRHEFALTSKTLDIAKKIWINLETISPIFSTSSTFIRKELILNRTIKPIWLDDSVYNYILENDLYILNKWSVIEYRKYWEWFIESLDSGFYEYGLLKLDVPEFNKLQHKDWWKEKFIRYVIKQKGFKWCSLEEFTKKALQYNY